MRRAQSASDNIEAQLQKLQEMPIKQLKAEWRRFYRSEPPIKMRRDLMIRAVAYKIQERAFGGLKGPVKRKLKAAMAAYEKDEKGKPPSSPAAAKLQPGIRLVREWHGKHCGLGMRMLIDGRPAGNRVEPNEKLIRLIATAHRMFEKLSSGKGVKMKEIAEQEGYGDSYATRIMRLAFLSPDITATILNGTQPPGMTPDTLMRDTKLPLDWNDHAEFFKVN